jgi:hypothetical protein
MGNYLFSQGKSIAIAAKTKSHTISAWDLEILLRFGFTS